MKRQGCQYIQRRDHRSPFSRVNVSADWMWLRIWMKTRNIIVSSFHPNSNVSSIAVIVPALPFPNYYPKRPHIQQQRPRSKSFKYSYTEIYPRIIPYFIPETFVDLYPGKLPSWTHLKISFFQFIFLLSDSKFEYWLWKLQILTLCSLQV